MASEFAVAAAELAPPSRPGYIQPMHQLVALAIFLILALGKSAAAVTPAQQIAYLLGQALERVVIFMALQVVVYFGAKLVMPQERYASFTATRLNYLTLAILVFIISAQLKH